MILIVDDSKLFTASYKFLFEAFQIPYECVISSEQALKFLQKESVNLILTDIHLPGINGIGLCKKIRAQEKIKRESKRIPIVAVSSDIEFFKHELENVGFDGWINKPPTRRTLVEILEKFNLPIS